jgi:hypothetical protein
MILRYLLPEFTCVVRGQGQYLRERSRYSIATPHSAVISWSVSGPESIWHHPVCSVNRINPWYQIEVLPESRVFAPNRSFTDMFPVIKMKVVCLCSEVASLTSRRCSCRISVWLLSNLTVVVLLSSPECSDRPLPLPPKPLPTHYYYLSI